MKKGFVALVGAGPGSCDLLTIRGKQLLQSADVVVYDRLVSSDILSLIAQSAEKIDVGKKSNNHPVPQHEINEILLEKAQKGLTVVRLKGGDPFVFGRGGEELELLEQNNISFEVVSGITSSIAAAAFAGIPITHRNMCSSFHVITGHQKQNEPLNINFEALVKAGGTLVFLMGVSSLEQIVQGLIDANMPKTTEVAIIQEGTRATQRKIIGNLHTIVQLAKENEIKSPSVIVVGEVCTLSDKFDWFSNRELFGKTVLVTRPLGSDSTLEEKLKRLGANVVTLPCVKLRKLSFEKELENCMSDVKNNDVIVFTSKNGVEFFYDFLKSKSLDSRFLHGKIIAAVGKATAVQLEKYGISADIIPQSYNSNKLCDAILSSVKTEQKIILLRAENGEQSLPLKLKNAGYSVADIGLYISEPYTAYTKEIEELLMPDKLIVTFTSASTVDGVAACLHKEHYNKIMGVCIGEQTAKRAQDYGINHVVSNEATIDSMVQKISEVSKT